MSQLDFQKQELAQITYEIMAKSAAFLVARNSLINAYYNTHPDHEHDTYSRIQRTKLLKSYYINDITTHFVEQVREKALIQIKLINDVEHINRQVFTDATKETLEEWKSELQSINLQIDLEILSEINNICMEIDFRRIMTLVSDFIPKEN